MCKWRECFRAAGRRYTPMTPSLVPFVEQEAGPSLRAIAEYEQTEVELLYRRDDLPRDEITARVDTIHESIRWAWNPDESDVVRELGAKRATIQVRENAVIVHLPASDDHGYLIGLEPDAARNLTTSIGECLTRVE